MHQVARDLQAGESASIEFKTSLSDTRKIVETVAAMATIGGGRIYVGVRDDGEVCGVQLGQGSLEQLVQRVLSGTDPRVFVDAERLQVGEHTVLLLRVPPGDGPHLAFGRAFYRSGPATVMMSRDEYERRLLDRLRESGGYELREVPGSDRSDLDPAAFDTFRRLAATRMPQAATTTNDELLERLHLVQADDVVSVAALLLFGRDPQGPLPQAVLRARVETADDPVSQEIRGTLMQQIVEAVAFVGRHTATTADRAGVTRVDRPQLPLPAVREAIANAVAHRDYRSTAPTQLVLDATGLRVWNPGHLPSPLTVEDLLTTHPSIPPNPYIARVLHLAGFIEEWGTGTTRIVQSLRDAGHPEPVFRDTGGGGIEVFLPFADQPASAVMVRMAEARERLPEGAWFQSRDYAEATGISKRTAAKDLGELEQRGLVRRGGTGKSTRWSWR